MKTITLLNEKGGVGKTTLATHIASGLAIRGQRVLLVDTDAQGHATIVMGAQKQPGLYNLLARRAPWKEVLHFVSPELYSQDEVKGQLFLVPSNVETRAIPSVVTDVSLFARRLAELNNHIDVVLIDTPPTPSMLHGSAYLATDYLLYPTQCHYLSIDGLFESMGRLEEIKVNRQQFGLPAVQVLGIIPTMYRSRTVDQSENLRELREKFGNLVWEPLANRTAWTEATTENRPVWFVDGSEAATREVMNIVKQVEKVMRHEQA